jgi:hypothetical protein
MVSHPRKLEFYYPNLISCPTLKEGLSLRVFESRLWRRIFGPKSDEVTGKWRKLYNEKRHEIYTVPNAVRVIKSKSMRWTRHVARMGKEK